LKLEYDEPLSKVPFRFEFRRYNKGRDTPAGRGGIANKGDVLVAAAIVLDGTGDGGLGFRADGADGVLADVPPAVAAAAAAAAAGVRLVGRCSLLKTVFEPYSSSA
jgi:hypothetical protein